MPRYAGSIALLRPDDVLTFACPVCGHQASMEVSALTSRVRSDLSIEQLDARSRCMRCGQRGQAELVHVETEED